MTSRDALNQAKAFISAEADALFHLAQSLNRSFMLAESILWTCRGKVIVTGMGKCSHVGRKIAATFQSTGTRAAFLHPAEAAHGDMGMIGDNDVVLALSNSGETDEVKGVLAYALRQGLETVAITSKAHSTLAMRAKIAVILPDVPEGCPINKAPMASAVMMMALGDAFAARMMVKRGFTADDFCDLHHGGYLGRRLEAVA